MMSHHYKLFGHVGGESRLLQIKIPREESVATLQKEIHEEKPAFYPNVDSDELILYKLDAQLRL